ncbi:MAG: S-layer homology domain-containing protein [Bacillota bacterium]
MKKIIGGFLAVALLASPFTQVAYAEEPELADPYYKYFAEDIAGHWAEEDMTLMQQTDVIKGIRGGDGLLYLQPNALITRAQFTSLVVRALELKTDQPGKTFTDVGNHWAKEEIRIASALGIISGKTETEFKPNMNITRAEIAAIVSRAFDPTVAFETGTPKEFSDVKPDHWAYEHIRKVSALDIVRGTTATTLSPNQNAKRAEAAVMLKRALWEESADIFEASGTVDQLFESEIEAIDAINEKDMARVFQINDSKRYGLAHEYEKLNGQIFESMFAEGEDAAIEVSGPEINIVYQTTRFIVVDVPHYMSDLYLTDPETGEWEEEPYTEDKSGYFYLIRRDGEWKIATADFYYDYLNFDF